MEFNKGLLAEIGTKDNSLIVPRDIIKIRIVVHTTK